MTRFFDNKKTQSRFTSKIKTLCIFNDDRIKIIAITESDVRIEVFL